MGRAKRDVGQVLDTGTTPTAKAGDPGRIRTCDPQIRNLVLSGSEAKINSELRLLLLAPRGF